MTDTLNKIKCLNSTHLKIIAMLTMFLDHAGKTLFWRYDWLTYIGRIAFPIFAFQIAEGYNHTKDFKAYLKRMFIYALIAEVPYNIMGGGLINPTSQNVLFTFCIALLVIRIIDNSFKKHKLLGILALVAGTFIGYMAGFIFMTDYMGYGVVTVVLLWVGTKIKFGWITQVLTILYVNIKMIGGLSLVWIYNGEEIWIPVQAFAVFSLIPILMYNGTKGPGGKKFQKAVYIFYPAHMLILGLLMIFFVY